MKRAVILLIAIAFSINAFSQDFEKHLIDDNFLKCSGIYAADLDNDGDDDIIGSAINANQVAMWRNDGGYPVEWTKIVVKSGFMGAMYVFAEDLNNDDYIDIIATAADGDMVAWFENDGEDQQDWQMHEIAINFDNAHGIFAIDMNDDDLIDVLATSAGSNKISWFENSMNGQFWQEHIIAENFNGTQSVHAKDMDDDGDIDVAGAAALSHTTAWWECQDIDQNSWDMHTMPGQFNVAHWVHICDLNDDGNEDILGAGYNNTGVAWWKNSGTEWTMHNIGVNFLGGLTAHADDLNNDGLLDVMGTANHSDDLGVWFNSGGDTPGWQLHMLDFNFDGAWPVYSADIDNDGDKDVISGADVAHDVAWWENKLIDYTFSADITHGHAPLAVEFSDSSSAGFEVVDYEWDFDGDGIVDATGPNPSHTFSEPAYYNISLTYVGADETFTKTFENYIRVFDGESALEFDGSNSYAICPAIPAINITSAFTAEAWINPAGWGQHSFGLGRIIDKNVIQLSLHGQGSTSYENHSLVLRIKHDNNAYSNFCTGENTIILNGWQHIAVSYDSEAGEAKAFVNGLEVELIEVAASTGPIKDNLDDELYIGDRANMANSFDGVIDELRIWDYARTAEQINETMSGTITGQEEGLIAYFIMNEADGNQIADSSPNLNHAECTSTLWAQGTGFIVTDIKEGKTLPKYRNQSLGNYPNPFNPLTSIRFELDNEQEISICIYNIKGRLVKTLANKESFCAGSHSLAWDGKNETGQGVPSGIYLCRLSYGNTIISNKMALIK